MTLKSVSTCLLLLMIFSALQAKSYLKGGNDSSSEEDTHWKRKKAYVNKKMNDYVRRNKHLFGGKNQKTSKSGSNESQKRSAKSNEGYRKNSQSGSEKSKPTRGDAKSRLSYKNLGNKRHSGKNKKASYSTRSSHSDGKGNRQTRYSRKKHFKYGNVSGWDHFSETTSNINQNKKFGANGNISIRGFTKQTSSSQHSESHSPNGQVSVSWAGPSGHWKSNQSKGFKNDWNMGNPWKGQQSKQDFPQWDQDMFGKQFGSFKPMKFPKFENPFKESSNSGKRKGKGKGKDKGKGKKGRMIGSFNDR